MNWASLRGRAMSARDSWPKSTDSVDAWAASVAETACWPFTSVGQGVAEETLEVYLNYADLKAANIAGWSAEDEARVSAWNADLHRVFDQAVPREARRSMHKEAVAAAVSMANNMPG